jgi:hypothetical protein
VIPAMDHIDEHFATDALNSSLELQKPHSTATTT